jgi:hypothetical protein
MNVGRNAAGRRDEPLPPPLLVEPTFDVVDDVAALVEAPTPFVGLAPCVNKLRRFEQT